MSTATPAITETLAFLADVADGATPPAIAQERLRTIQARHLDVELQLVWEQESYDHSFHFDVLVRTPDATTVSLGVCRDRALPWPLRGVHRFTWDGATLTDAGSIDVSPCRGLDARQVAAL